MILTEGKNILLSDKVIRTTKSLCPKCLLQIDASVVRKSDRIILSKTCPGHGVFDVILSRTPDFYEELDNFYFAVMGMANKLNEFEIWPTLECNMHCPICAIKEETDESANIGPDCFAIERFIKKSSAQLFIISGGEPTCRADLSSVIRSIKKFGKTVTINTNGLKLKELAYVRTLKNSGLDRVNLQFDGFSRQAYLFYRGVDLLDLKLKALDNLKSMDMPTVLNVTVAKDINEFDLENIIDFACRNNFINGINFFTICYTGGARDWHERNYIMPDEVIDLLEKQSQGRILKRDVFVFQKLHLAIKSFLKQKYCLYNQIYVLVRDKGSYQPINMFFNFKRAEPWLDRYSRLCGKNNFKAFFSLLVAIVSLFKGLRSLVLIKELILATVSYFLKTDRYLKSKRLLYISFATGCDPYKIDESVLKYCQNEIIAMDINSGDLVNQGSDGRYCLEAERAARDL